MAKKGRAGSGTLTEDDWVAKEFEISDLFTPSAPIDLVDYFSGRKTQIDELFQTVRERGQHALLYGERGVGKSSLSQVFKDMFPPTLQHIKAFRIRVYPTDTFAVFWNRMFNEWGHSKKDSNYEILATPEEVKREILKRFKPNDIPILIFDEFNDLIDKSASSQMAHLIKTLSDEAAKATIVIVGVAADVSEIISNMQSVQRCLRQILMPRMYPDDLNEILDRRIPRLGMTIDDEAQEKIVNLSRGLPAYVHNLGKYAAESAVRNRRLNIEDKDVDLAIDNVLKIVLHTIQEAYLAAVHSNSKNARYRHSLLACALATTDEAGYFVPSSVLDPLSKILGRPIVLSDMQKHLDRFLMKDHGQVLTRVGTAKRFRYRFTDPIMQPFVIMKGIHEKLMPPRSKSLLSYNPQRGLSI